MMRFRLRTLLIVLAVGPMVLWWTVPPAIRVVQDWIRPEPTAEEFDRLVAELFSDTFSRPAKRGSGLADELPQTVSPLP
jgi:hypothetical protein